MMRAVLLASVLACLLLAGCTRYPVVEFEFVLPDGFIGGYYVDQDRNYVLPKQFPERVTLYVSEEGVILGEEAQLLHYVTWQNPVFRYRSGTIIDDPSTYYSKGAEEIADRDGVTELGDGVTPDRLWFFVGTEEQWFKFLDTYPKPPGQVAKSVRIKEE